MKYVKMRGSARALDTLLLCAPTVPEMEELAAVVASARRALARLAAEPDAVVGGGAVETALAARIRARARRRGAFFFFAELERGHARVGSGPRVRRRAGGNGVSKRRGSLRAAPHRAAVSAAFSPTPRPSWRAFAKTSHSPTLAREPRAFEGRLDRSQPVESLGAKMEGIRKAIEVACAVMRTHAE